MRLELTVELDVEPSVNAWVWTAEFEIEKNHVGTDIEKGCPNQILGQLTFGE